jgi:hypothetical protein
MKTPLFILGIAAASLLTPLALGGCDREISHSSSTSVKSDGTVKEKEKTVTESPDGTITKEETQKRTAPANP